MDLDEEQRPMRMEGGGLEEDEGKEYRRIEQQPGKKVPQVPPVVVIGGWGGCRVWLVVSGYRWWLNFFSNCFGVVSVVCSWLFDWRDYVKAKDTLVQGLCFVVVIVLDL